MENYWILSYYAYTELNDPFKEVTEHKDFFKDRDVKSRVYISEQGINGQLSASVEDAKAYMEWLKEKKPFHNIQFKIHPYKEHTFPRTTVKYRKQLVGYDMTADLSKGGEHVSPQKWREMLESDEEILHLDVRNDFEWDIGHFKGAERAPCKTSRDFAKFADSLASREKAKEKPVMMSCTGGIRCEIFSAVLKEKGFKNVFQLDGGMVNYGLQEGGKHWLGKLFVFDDRMAVPLNESENTVIGKCAHCSSPSDDYYNCANMDCNFLFLSCRACIEELKGCCSAKCQSAPRLRPVSEQNPNKPFRKKYNYNTPGEESPDIV
ncbi:MAG: rhodanese-related sulfurtransferase [Waddliaceae bacterium]